MNILFCQWSQQQNRCLAWWNQSIWDLLAITCSSVPAPWLSFLAPLSSLLLTSSWSAGWGSPPPPGPDPSSYTHSEHKHHLFLLNYNQIIFSCGNKWWFDWYLFWHSRKVYIISLHFFCLCLLSTWYIDYWVKQSWLLSYDRFLNWLQVSNTFWMLGCWF